MRRPLVSVAVGFDCVAQPTTKQAKAPANARLRHLGISVSPSIAAQLTSGKQYLRKFLRELDYCSCPVSTTGLGNRLLTRSRLRELGRAMRTTRRLDRNGHRTFRTIL